MSDIFEETAPAKEPPPREPATPAAPLTARDKQKVFDSLVDNLRQISSDLVSHHFSDTELTPEQNRKLTALAYTLQNVNADRLIAFQQHLNEQIAREQQQSE